MLDIGCEGEAVEEEAEVSTSHIVSISFWQIKMMKSAFRARRSGSQQQQEANQEASSYESCNCC